MSSKNIVLNLLKSYTYDVYMRMFLHAQTCVCLFMYKHTTYTIFAEMFKFKYMVLISR